MLPLSQIKEIARMVMYAAEAEDLVTMLKRIANVTRELVGAKYAALGVPDGHGGLRHFQVSGISTEEIALMDHPPVGHGLIGAIMHEREVVMLEDMRQDPRSVGFPSGHPDMTRMLGVPVQVGDQLFGMLYLTDKENGEPFDINDRWIVETLAGYAALAIADTQLRENQHRLTLLEERQRIGMELHDGIIQSLYALGMHLDLIRFAPEHTPQKYQPVIDGLNTVIEDIRGYIMNLKVTHSKQRTCYELVEDVMARLYMPPSLNISIEVPDILPPFHQEEIDSLCMVLLEALSNAVRHAQAKTIGVRVQQNEYFFYMTIYDDGHGFNPETHVQTDASHGLGLKNMRERITQHGGVLEIRSNPNMGTSVIIKLPITKKS
ncbi:MAG TPA: GAF domain-containing protein [Aggregatilineales bacterium]|nr:GAF domain-containing protein [Aggregatilineales bacterium]